MEKKKLTEIYQETLEKPEFYHYVCYGGASFEMINTYTDKNIFKCKHQGDKNWMTPVCETCTGLKRDELALTEYQEDKNRGITVFYNAIINEFEN